METGVSPATIQRLAGLLHAKVIETPISWVLLTPDRALKIKRPVVLDFVDYGSLEARRRFCEEEVRLNARLAPGLYLGVSRITGTPAHPLLDGPGEPQEYAVCMRRFPDGALFSERAMAGNLGADEVDALAALLAKFHNAAPRLDPSLGFALPAARRAAALAALGGIRQGVPESGIAALRSWLERESGRLHAAWFARRESGFVRECHGDLHLANLLSLETGVAAFDCIEFDPALRCIDIIDDVAFACMDLRAFGLAGLSSRLLNGWLDRTGDHAGVGGLRFSMVYRALVRARVASLRQPADLGAVQRYIAVALDLIRPGTPRLTITHGLPGSGKTRASQQLLEQTGAIRLRSDVERKRLFGLETLHRPSGRGADIYTPEASDRTYAHLESTARYLLMQGWEVILDATFLRRRNRQAAQALATECGAAFSILHCDAAPAVLRQRLERRQGDASDAGPSVLAALRSTAEPLDASERAFVITPPAEALK